jgi:ubiquinone/menaquinone biosynthesis C-methylase UbiE
MYNRAAATYERVGPPFFSHFGRRLVDSINLKDSAHVLDVACGAGAVLLAAAKRVGASGFVVGTDSASGMVERARYEIRYRGISNATVARMDAIALAFADCVFDAVLCGFAFNSFPTPEVTLQQFQRVLRSHGQVGISVSEGWWWEYDERWQWHRDLVESLGIQVAFKPRRFPRTDTLSSLLTRHGFVHVSVVEENYDLVFTDADEWWRWCWSHGYREVMESMTPAQLEQYRVICYEHIQEGPIHSRLSPVFIAAGTKLI